MIKKLSKTHRKSLNRGKQIDISPVITAYKIVLSFDMQYIEWCQLHYASRIVLQIMITELIIQLSWEGKVK